MQVVLPFHSGDSQLLSDQLTWINRLGFLWNHHALLIADGAVPYNTCMEIMGKARSAFASVRIQNIPHTPGWIVGSNMLFLRALESCAGKPFLWCEPDVVPLRPGWLDLIAQEYEKHPGKFLGSVVSHTTPNLPSPYLEGCAVYPANAHEIMRESFKPQISWTLACTAGVMPHAVNSPLFQHLWGEPNLSPTFVEEGAAKPRNGFYLRQITPGAALFHRCKDPSLINLLRKKFFPDDKQILVVMAVFAGDAELAKQDLEWLREIKQQPTHELILWHERTMGRDTVKLLVDLAGPIFKRVQPISYPRTHGPNQTWQLCCLEMAKHGKPWFWWEPDCVPLKREWIAVLQSRYDRCGKPFFGPIVRGPGHVNGTSVYPSNAASLLPQAMTTKERFGFDVIMKDEMIHLCADAGDLIHHAWVERGGVLHSHGAGEHPTFPNIESLNRISKKAVMFHRVKDSSLIRQLRATLPK